jgi:hypothetical protein
MRMYYEHLANATAHCTSTPHPGSVTLCGIINAWCAEQSSTHGAADKHDCCEESADTHIMTNIHQGQDIA